MLKRRHSVCKPPSTVPPSPLPAVLVHSLVSGLMCLHEPQLVENPAARIVTWTPSFHHITPASQSPDTSLEQVLTRLSFFPRPPRLPPPLLPLLPAVCRGLMEIREAVMQQIAMDATRWESSLLPVRLTPPSSSPEGMLSTDGGGRRHATSRTSSSLPSIMPFTSFSSVLLSLCLESFHTSPCCS